MIRIDFNQWYILIGNQVCWCVKLTSVCREVTGCLKQERLSILHYQWDSNCKGNIKHQKWLVQVKQLKLSLCFIIINIRVVFSHGLINRYLLGG